MSTLTRLAPDAGHVANPETGELLDLARADTDQLAALREALTELDRERKTALRQVDAEIVARTDAALASGELSQHSFDVGEFHIEVPSIEASRKVDVMSLWGALLKRAPALGIAERVIDDLFVARYYLGKSRWNTLIRQHPELEQLYGEHAEPGPRLVKVTRNRQRAIDSTATED